MVEFTAPVYRSMRVRRLILGLPPITFGIFVILTYFTVVFLKIYLFLAISLILWFLARQLTRKDQWLMDIVLFSLKQKDIYTP